ncbi:hypothetical protein [Nevskia ramosa]|uniref:hypothetical protein n=1 Tax=Nevskia ramosa TaxID=64002 RepID=UPI0012EC877D|nr:hypothetical protein [Nevskia ramosa]
MSTTVPIVAGEDFGARGEREDFSATAAAGCLTVEVFTATARLTWGVPVLLAALPLLAPGLATALLASASGRELLTAFFFRPQLPWWQASARP